MGDGDRNSEFVAVSPALDGLNAAEQFLGEIRWQFEHDAWKIRRCLEQLRDEELDWRPNEACNSAASIIVHICGSTDQWMSAIAGMEYERNRAAEFAKRSDMDRHSLMRLVEKSVKLALDTLTKLNPATLNQPIVIQGFENSMLTALYTVERHQAEHIALVNLHTSQSSSVGGHLNPCGSLQTMQRRHRPMATGLVVTIRECLRTRRCECRSHMRSLFALAAAN